MLKLFEFFFVEKKGKKCEERTPIYTFSVGSELKSVLNFSCFFFFGEFQSTRGYKGAALCFTPPFPFDLCDIILENYY